MTMNVNSATWMMTLAPICKPAQETGGTLRGRGAGAEDGETAGSGAGSVGVAVAMLRKDEGLEG